VAAATAARSTDASGWKPDAAVNGDGAGKPFVPVAAVASDAGAGVSEIEDAAKAGAPIKSSNSDSAVTAGVAACVVVAVAAGTAGAGELDGNF
jgi:hypothetical protein